MQINPVTPLPSPITSISPHTHIESNLSFIPIQLSYISHVIKLSFSSPFSFYFNHHSVYIISSHIIFILLILSILSYAYPLLLLFFCVDHVCRCPLSVVHFPLCTVHCPLSIGLCYHSSCFAFPSVLDL